MEERSSVILIIKVEWCVNVMDKYLSEPRAGLGTQTEENKRRFPQAMGVSSTDKVIALVHLLPQARGCQLSESLHQPLLWWGRHLRRKNRALDIIYQNSAKPCPLSPKRILPTHSPGQLLEAPALCTAGGESAFCLLYHELS